MNYKVFNEITGKMMELDEDWMFGIKTENAIKFSFDGSHVFVTYKNGKVVCYGLYFGNWGFPTTLN